MVSVADQVRQIRMALAAQHKREGVGSIASAKMQTERELALRSIYGGVPGYYGPQGSRGLGASMPAPCPTGFSRNARGECVVVIEQNPSWLPGITEFEGPTLESNRRVDNFSMRPPNFRPALGALPTYFDARNEGTPDLKNLTCNVFSSADVYAGKSEAEKVAFGRTFWARYWNSLKKFGPNKVKESDAPADFIAAIKKRNPCKPEHYDALIPFYPPGGRAAIGCESTSQCPFGGRCIGGVCFSPGFRCDTEKGQSNQDRICRGYSGGDPAYCGTEGYCIDGERRLDEPAPTPSDRSNKTRAAAGRSPASAAARARADAVADRAMSDANKSSASTARAAAAMSQRAAQTDAVAKAAARAAARAAAPASASSASSSSSSAGGRLFVQQPDAQASQPPADTSSPTKDARDRAKRDRAEREAREAAQPAAQAAPSCPECPSCPVCEKSACPACPPAPSCPSCPPAPACPSPSCPDCPPCSAQQRLMSDGGGGGGEGERKIIPLCPEKSALAKAFPWIIVAASVLYTYSVTAKPKALPAVR